LKAKKKGMEKGKLEGRGGHPGGERHGVSVWEDEEFLSH